MLCTGLAVAGIVTPARPSPLTGTPADQASHDAMRKDLGYRPLHPDTYGADKAAAAQRAGQIGGTHVRTSAATPTTGPSWSGISESDVAPPDTYGAIGPQSYIETVNIRIAI